MLHTKASIFNLALGALLLNKRIADTTSDPSSENQTLNVHWDVALQSAIQDMDLDATSSEAVLELIEEEPNDLWSYAYKYPSNCSLFRRIQSAVVKDVRSTRVPFRTVNHDGVKAIYTNEIDAIGEYVSTNFPLSLLSASAGLAVAYRLAYLSSPLIVGKDARKLRENIQQMYAIAKTEAQEHDRLENANFDDDDVISEFVEARLE